MKIFAALAVLAALAAQVWALTINTPTSVVQCQPVLLSWSDGTAPYYLSILPGGQTTATALKSFDATNSTSLTWTVDIAAGTSITLQIRDNTGTIAYSDIVTIQTSSDSSCVSSSTAASASGGATSAATGTGATSTGTGAASTSKATGTSTKASSTGTATGSSSSSSSSSGARRDSSMNAAGVAGVLGLIGAALL